MGLFSFLFGSKKNGSLDEFLNQDYIILDVRTKNEYETDHIASALHIPINEIKQHIDKVKSHNKPVIVHCQSGVRSAKGASILRKHGIKAVNGGGIASLRNKIS